MSKIIDISTNGETENREMSHSYMPFSGFEASCCLSVKSNDIKAVGLRLIASAEKIQPPNQISSSLLLRLL
jgi:hypothetical protein